MKVLVFGAGVIGTLHAWAFERAGHTVRLFVRPGHKARWQGGIRLELLDARRGERTEVRTVFRPTVVSSLSAEDGYDLVLDAVRYSQVEGALPELVRILGRSPVLLFSNNWGGFGFLEGVLAKDRYVLGLPRAGGVIADGVLNGALEGGVVLGASTCGRAGSPEDESTAKRNLDRAVQLFQSAGFTTEIVENMEHWYWTHFASTAVWAAAGAKAGGYDALAHDTRAIREALAAGRESMAICTARGAEVRKCSDARPFLSPSWMMAPLIRRFLGGEVSRRMAQTRPEYVGEFRRIYDDVVETGHRLRVLTPHLDGYGPSVHA
jgi:2-dehydropantoate 2-reductase